MSVRRFRHEVALQQLLDHPHVMPVVTTYLKEPQPWFVMPMMDHTLQDEVESELSQERSENLFAKVLDAVAYAHGKNVIHRDLKPGNIMINSKGEPVVSDFGLGKNLASNSSIVTTTTMQAGSFVYSAPEQLKDLRSADKRADIFALGKILQAMVTGELPVRHDDPNVPRRHRHFIAKCTEHEREHRYQTIEDVVSAFIQVRRGVETPEAPREEFKRLVAEWQELPEGEDLAALDKLHGLLDRHSDNAEFYQVVIPQIPVELMEQYIAERPSEFRRMIADYDSHVSGNLPFSYCDVVANLYERLMQRSEDRTVRKLAITRLLALGRSHNRFYVGEVSARVLSTLRDESDVLLATETIKAQPEDAAWCAGYMQDLALADPIRAELRRVKKTHVR